MANPYVQARTKRRLRCPDQPDPRPDPNPNPNPNPNLWGALGLLSRSAGAVLSLRAILKTLHVCTMKRLVDRTRPVRFRILPDPTRLAPRNWKVSNPIRGTDLGP